MAAEITIPFDKASDLARVLTPARLRLLQVAREEPLDVSKLARKLKRDTRAVSRDVDVLEKLKVIRNVGYATNPGHGFRRIVTPAAAKIRLVLTV